MSTPTPTHAPETGLAPHFAVDGVRRLREAQPALLGCLGAVLITVGGLGAGSTRLHDPLLESLHLSWLRFGHGLVASSVLLWGGVALMLIAWLWLGRRVIDGTAREYTMIATTGFWLAPLLLSVPVFSRDTYSYLAQGLCCATASTRMSSARSRTRMCCWTTSVRSGRRPPRRTARRSSWWRSSSRCSSATMW